MAKSAKKNAAVATSGNGSSNSQQANLLKTSDIARRAYALYLGRGREDGHDVEDWLRAEHELADVAAESTV